jgi:hypothetical protein
VPAGLDARQIGAALLSDGIGLISVQAGPKAGPNLLPVLSSLAEYSGGSFVRWDGEDERRKRLNQAVTDRLTWRIHRPPALSPIERLQRFKYGGAAVTTLTIPDAETLRQMRHIAVRFNVDPHRGGVLVQPAFMLANNDLHEPKVQIDKRTLDGLITLFGALGLAGVEPSTMKERATHAVLQLTGERYDPRETIEDIVRKRVGIQFRTRLLDFNLEYLAAMVRDERSALGLRFLQHEKILSDFRAATLDEMDRSPAV